MEAPTTVRGRGPHERVRALELQHQEKEGTLVSKSIYDLGHNHNSHTETEASILPAGAGAGGRHKHKKRPLELHLREEEDEDEDDDDTYWEETEATFMAGADGAYIDFEMPKRIHLGYNVGESSARIRALHAEDERDVALRHRHRCLAAAMMRDMHARAMANKAAAAPRT